MLPLAAGEPTPFPFLQTRFQEASGAFSPDGRWIAYSSDEFVRWEVYVTPFPGAHYRILEKLGGGGMAEGAGSASEDYDQVKR
jgi:Tol biopolymer transport system component